MVNYVNEDSWKKKQKQDTHQGQPEVRAKTTLAPLGLRPGKVGELRVGGDTNDLSTNSGELVEGLVESKDLSGANDL